jgi:hypothetical protein
MVMFVCDIVDLVQLLSPKKNISEIRSVPVLEWNGGKESLTVVGPSELETSSF